MGELLKQPVPPETPTKPPDKDLDDLRFRLDRLKGFEVAGLIRRKVVPAGTPSRIEVPAGTPFRDQVPSHENGNRSQSSLSQDSMSSMTGRWPGTSAELWPSISGSMSQKTKWPPRFPVWRQHFMFFVTISPEIRQFSAEIPTHRPVRLLFVAKLLINFIN